MNGNKALAIVIVAFFAMCAAGFWAAAWSSRGDNDEHIRMKELQVDSIRAQKGLR